MAIDVSKLRVSVEEGERWRRTLNITVPSDMVHAERKAAVRQLSSRLKLPGFREGRIPAAVVEKRFGPVLEQELLDRVIGEAYRGVLAERALRPISEGEVGEVDYRPDADLSFAVSFDVAPQVELARLGGFKVRRPDLRVTDEEVDKVLGRVREQEGTWIPVEAGSPEPGEKVTIRIQRLLEEDDEPRRYELTLGEEEAVPDVERAIQSLEVGGVGDFTVTFPDEGAEDAPEPQELRIFLDARKRLELPELDDELARAAGDFQTLEELRSRIREDLEKEAEREAEAQLRGALLEQVLAANPFEIPESMVDQYVRSALGDPKDFSAEQLAEAKEHFRPRAVLGVKRFLVVSRVAETQGLAATDEEIDARIEEIAGRSGVSPTDVYSRLQRGGQMDQLEREITEQKVFDFLKTQSEIVAVA